jgi:hypothetical protein
VGTIDIEYSTKQMSTIVQTETNRKKLSKLGQFKNLASIEARVFSW